MYSQNPNPNYPNPTLTWYTRNNLVDMIMTQAMQIYGAEYFLAVALSHQLAIHVNCISVQPARMYQSIET